MSYVNINRKVLNAMLVACMLVLGSCGGNDTPIIPQQPIPTQTNPGGGGFVGGGGFGCGGIGGQPIGNPNFNQNTPFYSNMQPLSGYSGNVQPSINLFVSHGQNPSTILGSVQLNLDVAAMLGFASSQFGQQPVCASSQGQTGQTFGTGYQFSAQHFIIEQLTMSGFVNAPIYNTQVPVPVQVAIQGQSCQGGGGSAYVDLFTRRVVGCVILVLGQQQVYYFQAQ